MRKHTITDAEAQQLLSGATPEGRPELAELAASIADVRRDASQLAAPQPSAALAARLDQPALGVSAGSEPTPLKGIKKMAASIAGLGLAAKLAAATGVLALGLTGVGAAGALPGPAQDAFDGVVSTFTATEDEVVDDGALEECVVDDGTVDDGTTDEGTDGTTDEGAAEDELYGATEDGTTDEGTDDSTTDEGTDEGAVSEECADELPVGSGEFSDWVKQGAQDPDKVGAEFGAAVSEQARELKNEKAEERAANGGNNGNGQGGDDADDEGDDEGEETVEETSTGNGKPAGKPGGGRP